jgi:hypothetical protein
MGIDDRMVVAFERIHELYGIRDHDQAAKLVIELCHELVDAEAGSCMLISPGRYELYIAAATGSAKEALLGRRISFTKGIVGFATRTSSVISCSDPEGDPRFDKSLDAISGFATRNILVAPISYEGHTLGAIELINSPHPGGFSQEDSNILSYLGGSFGEFIQTSLPSREADFSDKDFMPHGKRTPTPPPARPAPPPVPARPSSQPTQRHSSPPTQRHSSPPAHRPSSPPAHRPSSPPAHRPSGPPPKLPEIDQLFPPPTLPPIRSSAPPAASSSAPHPAQTSDATPRPSKAPNRSKGGKKKKKKAGKR